MNWEKIISELKDNDYKESVMYYGSPNMGKNPCAEIPLDDKICIVRKCKGCGQPLLLKNEWMEDGCPCNSPKGCNEEKLCSCDIMSLMREGCKCGGH